MKNNLAILFIALGLFSAIQSNATLNTPNYIIGDETQITVVPDVYMNAISVELELILEDGSTFARATTSAGNGVSFCIIDTRVKAVRVTYTINSFQSYIIEEEVPPI